MKRFPLVTVLLVVVNVLVYRLELASGGIEACYRYGLIPAHFTQTALFTSLFLHDPTTLLHLGGNMAFLAVFGAVVEEAVGGPVFLALYLLAGAAGGILHVAVDPSAVVPLVGASGAIFGVMAVAAVIYPRLIGFVIAFGALNIWNAFTGNESSVSFACHIGGLVFGVCFVLILRVINHEALEAA